MRIPDPDNIDHLREFAIHLFCFLSDFQLFICRNYQNFDLTVRRTDFADSASGQLIALQINLNTEFVQAAGAELADVW